MRAGVETVHTYLRNPSCLNLVLNLPQITVSMFRLPFGTFSDTNNLSLVTFVEYGTFCIVYPSDIGEAGWKQMLLNSAFSTLLRRVNLFVTSHHGRESGCCAELFTYSRCNPRRVYH